MSNNDPQMSSSLISEKLDQRHVINLSNPNQKNIKVSLISIIANLFKFKNKFGEPVQPSGA